MAKAWWMLSLNALGAAAALQDSPVVIVTVPVCITPFSYGANVTQTTLPTPTSPASASATFCGHPYKEAGAEYTVSCDATLQGQVIYVPGGMRRRQNYAYEPALAGLTLDQCLQDCNGIPSCQAVSLVDGDCSLFSSVLTSVASVGGVVAYNSQRFGGYSSGSSGSSVVSSSIAASTGISSASLTPTGSPSTTATTSSSSSSLATPTSLSTSSVSSTIPTTASLTSAQTTAPSTSRTDSSVSTTLMTAASTSSSMRGPAPMSSSTPPASSSAASKTPPSSTSASTSTTSIVSSSIVVSTMDTGSADITPPASATSDTPTDTSTDSSASASPTSTAISSCDNIDFYAASVICYDAYDNYFIVQQGKSYLGLIANREGPISFPDCLTQCDVTSGCVAVNYGSGTCDLMTRVLGTQTPEGGSNGQVASRPAGVSTTYTAAPASMPT
ncbi:hypothetical protein LTR91_002562 [Friedmanniomyces endolithicus]|uniref:Apple domain-containing protein n=1 Tax=Friedmanniomyces endolithicus TaxID=329885 RepID=A0AAN6FSK8_9PEZI|nr:hypothetical protein LTR35_004648 [Friedmanniomyces endolithicus]KAK0299113.1 hypothetical protein LTS00_002223 [Friedmanniomyces endolithicus]KAK0306782.1 hypothetical protein LTR01_006078 [Friedmanniomyces endolithicus]KAK0322787.1 hypothetical protein LTR82_006244 [Friedmanniomyces endolithicus]KAK0825512.1 hypothetical protein LTR73_007059 [Friedmanniomyces endolithicus]